MDKSEGCTAMPYEEKYLEPFCDILWIEILVEHKKIMNEAWINVFTFPDASVKWKSASLCEINIIFWVLLIQWEVAGKYFDVKETGVFFTWNEIVFFNSEHALTSKAVRKKLTSKIIFNQIN